MADSQSLQVPQQSLFEKELGLEREALEMGIERYRRGLLRSGEVDSPVGERLMSTLLKPFGDALHGWLKDSASPKGGHTKYLLKDHDPYELAVLTLRAALKSVSGSHGLTATAVDLGSCIEEHLAWSALWSEKKGYALKVQESLKKATSDRHRRAVVRRVTSKMGHRRVWSDRQRLSVGAYLLEYLVQSTGLFHVVRQGAGRRAKSYLRASDEILKFLADGHERVEVLRPLYMPMVVPPQEWTSVHSGGYLTRDMSVYKWASRATLEAADKADLSEVLSAINALQRVPWRINPSVHRLARSAWERGDRDVMPPAEDDPLPALPADIDTNEEALKSWKRRAARVHQANASLRARRLNVMFQLDLAKRLQQYDRLYFVHHMDWRGRVYPVGTYIHPQADDLGRALLTFAEGKPLGENGGYWLAVHLANLFGFDKVTFDERVEWAREHSPKILECAMDPEQNRWWTTADKPWQFLAACHEWLGFSLEGESYVSHLPVAVDGSCNGLQHLSAAMLDPEGGYATNLVPSGKPSDIYQLVADRVTELLLEEPAGPDKEHAKWWLNRGIDRGIVKRPVMTLPYGATAHGMTWQIENELRKRGVKGDLFLQASYLSKVSRRAIGDVVVAARKLMAWFQECARVCSDYNQAISWINPAGLPVLQQYTRRRGDAVDVWVGGIRRRLMLSVKGEALDTRRQTVAISPNVVHSWDASHLMRVVNVAVEEGIESFAAVHDSYGTHACDVDDLQWVIRAVFVDMHRDGLQLHQFRQDLLSSLPEGASEKVPQVPDLGNLDLTMVMYSDYFFA